MSCKKPSGMVLVNDLPKSIFEYTGLIKNKFKITKDKNKAYKFFKLHDYYEKHVDEIISSLVPKHLISKAELIQIPCGNCLSCRLDYSKQWATRCYGESLYSENNYFITLTYDDEHLPKGSLNNPTLVKEHFQKFIKSLRNYGFEGLRYFGCGEYGDNTHRPHLHIILFNCPLTDLTENLPYINNDGSKSFIKKCDENGDPYYYSEIIANAWKYKGQILIGRCTYKSCAYVARYVVKKSKGVNSSVYKSLGIVPEFVLMSKKPGIGEKFILDNYEKFKDNPALFIPSQNPFLSPIGKYFSKIQKKIDVVSYEERRNQAKDIVYQDLAYKASLSPKSLSSRNLDELNQLEEKTKILKRVNIDI